MRPPPLLIDTDITITSPATVPGNAAEVVRITGNLTISGTITEFPNFATLEVVQGNLTIDNITTPSLTTLADIFPALDSVYGNFHIQNQSVVETITGFVELDTIGTDTGNRPNYS